MVTDHNHNSLYGYIIAVYYRLHPVCQPRMLYIGSNNEEKGIPPICLTNSHPQDIGENASQTLDSQKSTSTYNAFHKLFDKTRHKLFEFIFPPNQKLNKRLWQKPFYRILYRELLIHPCSSEMVYCARVLLHMYTTGCHIDRAEIF